MSRASTCSTSVHRAAGPLSRLARPFRRGAGVRLGERRRLPPRRLIEARRAENSFGPAAESTERAELDHLLARLGLRHLLARALQEDVVVRDVGEVVDETRRVVVRRVPERPFHVIHRSFVLIRGVFFGT